MPIVDNKYLDERRYQIIDNNGNKDKTTLVDILEHKADTRLDPTHIEFQTIPKYDDCEDIMDSNGIINVI